MAKIKAKCSVHEEEADLEDEGGRLACGKILDLESDEGKLKKICYKRRDHSATLIGDNVFLFGGGDYKNNCNDLQTFDTTTMTLKEWH